MQMIADAFVRESIPAEFYSVGDSCCLDNIRFFRKNQNLRKNYVYLVDGEEVRSLPESAAEICLIYVGDQMPENFHQKAPLLHLNDRRDLADIFMFVQDIFEEYQQWDWKLTMALGSEKPLDEMLLASMEILHNPMFIHDHNFFILSSPRHVPGMLEWERDKRTGRNIAPVGLINDFRVDPEYLNGLSKKGSVLFSANQRGYRILFRNLWMGDRYEGRILVDEIQNALQPGDYAVLDYLGNFIEMCIRTKDLFWVGVGNGMDEAFADFLDEKTVDEQQIMNYLQFLGWNRYERYLCLRIVTDQKNFNTVSFSATMSQVDAQLPSGKTLIYDSSIVVIVNLSVDHVTAKEVLSKLAITLRENLLRIGVSSEIQDFMMLPKGYRQAKIALNFGRASDSTYWCYYFDDYMLDYIIHCASREVPIQLLCDDALQKLKKYDTDNNKELYDTLLVYLKLERNMLQTAKALFIHRSTLAYRLERIQKLTGIDLDDPAKRMQLLLSYYMLEGEL